MYLLVIRQISDMDFHDSIMTLGFSEPLIQALQQVALRRMFADL